MTTPFRTVRRRTLGALALSCSGALSMACATTSNAPASETPANKTKAPAEAPVDATPSEPKGVVGRVGAAAFAVPVGFREVGFHEVPRSEGTHEIRRARILVPSDHVISAQEKPKALYGMGTSRGFSSPFTAQTCLAFAQNQAGKKTLEPGSVEAITLPRGSACVFVVGDAAPQAGERPTSGRRLHGQLMANGRGLLIVGAGEAADGVQAMKTLLASVHYPDGARIVGDFVEAELPNGYTRLDQPALDKAGGILVANVEPTDAGDLLKAVIAVVPVTTPKDDAQATTTADCAAWGATAAGHAKRSLRSVDGTATRSVTFPGGPSCVALTDAGNGRDGDGVLMPVFFAGGMATVSCTFGAGDGEAEKACIAFAGTVRRTVPRAPSIPANGVEK